MTTQCDAGCSRPATTKGRDGADYCPDCYKASRGGRQDVTRRYWTATCADGRVSEFTHAHQAAIHAQFHGCFGGHHKIAMVEA